MKLISGREKKGMGTRQFSALTILLLTFCLLISGCSSETKDMPKASKAIKKAPAETAKPQTGDAVEKMKQQEDSFAGYTATALKDPFVPFLKEEVVAVRKRGPLSPLEKFDLGELKLVGILMKGNETVGLIEDSEGKGYSVKRGVKIGKNGGVISKITKNEIIVVEEYFDLTGRKVTREKTLMLPLPGGE